ncbi:MAG: hypothetical protein WCA35_23050, partial [Kovacikia sp.]
MGSIVRSFQNATGLPSSMVDFTAKNWPFSIAHPKSWSIFETTHGNNGDPYIVGLVIFPHGANPLVEIARKEMDHSTLEEVVKWGKERAQRCQDYKPGVQQGTSVSGLDGVRFEYSCLRKVSYFSKSPTRFKCLDNYVLKDSSAYALSSCAIEDRWMEVEPVFE